MRTFLLHFGIAPTLLLPFCIQAASLPAAGTWIQPPPAGAAIDYSNNQNLVLGKQYTLQWNNSLTSYSIWLWQQDTGRGYTYPGDPIYTQDAAALGSNSYSWTVNIQDFTLQGSKIYFLSICQNNSLVGASTSHYFNVLDSGSSTSSTSTSTSTSTSSSGSSASVTNTAPSTSSPTSSLSPSPSTSTSTGTHLALGLGLGLGIPLLLLLTGWFYLWYRRNRPSATGTATPRGPKRPDDSGASSLSAHSQMRNYQRQELSAVGPRANYVVSRHELDPRGDGEGRAKHELPG